MIRARRVATGALALAAALLALVALRMLLYRPLDGGLELAWPDASVLPLRRTAVLVACSAGAALAVSGVLLQALLRNPLASPFVLGVSSGAALGVMTAIFVAHQAGRTWTGDADAEGPALVGALVVLGVVATLGRRRGGLDPLTLLLVGVVVSAMCGGCIMLLQHLVPQGLRGDLVTWMTGHVRQGVAARTLAVATATAGVGTLLGAWLGPTLDAMALGDDEARSVGVRLAAARAAVVALAGALAAVAVALAGPIAFVGLVAPHLARLLVGPRHAGLVVASAVAGAVLLVGADCAAQVAAVGTGRMPAGVFTALLGGPVFIALLRGRSA